jgi:hypothetical protein
MGRLPAGSSGPREGWSERVKAWVEQSCAEQGVPVKVTDRRVVAQVAELLRSPAQSRQTGRSRDSSKRLKP